MSLVRLAEARGDSDLANDHWRQAFQVLESMNLCPGEPSR